MEEKHQFSNKEAPISGLGEKPAVKQGKNLHGFSPNPTLYPFMACPHSSPLQSQKSWAEENFLAFH